MTAAAADCESFTITADRNPGALMETISHFTPTSPLHQTVRPGATDARRRLRLRRRHFGVRRQ
jgi:hypothetical protein